MSACSGLRALVTGANRGIGLAFVEVLADAGAERIVAGVRRPEAASALKERFGERVSLQSIDAAAAAIGDVDLVVSNAGVSLIGQFLEQDERDIRHMFDVNVFGPHRLILRILPKLAARRGGGDSRSVHGGTDAGVVCGSL